MLESSQLWRVCTAGFLSVKLETAALVENLQVKEVSRLVKKIRGKTFGDGEIVS